MLSYESTIQKASGCINKKEDFLLRSPLSDPLGVGGNTIWDQDGCVEWQRNMFVISKVHYFFENDGKTDFIKW